MNNSQLEFGLKSLRACRSYERRQRRAHWWFERMRQIVDCAVDRQPLPSAPEEQICFGEGSRRRAPRTSPPIGPENGAKAEEGQICAE